jgi:hypothetical protein
LNKLTRIGEDLRIGGNQMLTNLEGLNNLANVGGNLAIENNPVLETRLAQALADRLIAAGYTGTVTIDANKP